MKTSLALCFLGIISIQLSCYAQGNMPLEEPSKPRPLYFSLDGIVAVPAASLKSYSKVKGGFRFALGKPLRAYSPFSVGLEIGGIFSGSKKDQFKGLEVTTSTTVVELQPFVRYVPRKDHAVNPYVDFSVGIMAATTSTTSEIIDEPTFLEMVLFNSQTDVETTTHQSGGSTNFAFGLGTGVIIKNLVMVGIRYQHANPVDYINTNNVSIENGAIQYEVHRIPLDMIQITIGIGIWKMR